MSTKFKKGDIISFIDEKLEGVVSHVDQNGNIHIESSDGFDMQVSAKEIIKTGELQEQQPIENTPPATINRNNTDNDDLMGITDKESLLLFVDAFEENKVLTGKVRLTLVNKTGYGVYFTLYGNNQKQKELIHGQLDDNSDFVLDEKERGDWTGNEKFTIQYLFYGAGEFIPPMRFDFSVSMPGLDHVIKSKSGKTFFGKIMYLYTVQEIEQPKFDELLKKYKPGELLVNTVKPKDSFDAKKWLQSDTFFENVIDLHIEELTDDLTGLTSDAMLQIQLNKFHKELNNAINNRLHKIIFIHGVGKGRLKEAIQKELTHYPHIKTISADPARFGSGATEVILE
jgi:Smr domain